MKKSRDLTFIFWSENWKIILLCRQPMVQSGAIVKTIHLTNINTITGFQFRSTLCILVFTIERLHFLECMLNRRVFG